MKNKIVGYQSVMIRMLRLAIMGEVVADEDVHAVVRIIKNSELPFDWMDFLREVTNQAVLGLVWGVIEKNTVLSSLLSIDDKLEWFGQNRKIIESNKEINAAISKITKVLNSEGISSILLKGQGCAYYYPNPMYRNSGDIDLFVGKDNFYKSHECLKKAGLVGNWIHEDIMHGMLSCEDVTLEIHKYPAFLAGERTDNRFQSIVKSYLLQNKADCQNIIIDDTEVFLMPIELNTVYTFIHMFKHFVGSGIKPRQVMDWLLMCKAVKDKDLLAQYVKDFGIENGWKVFAQMAVEQIGVPASQVPLYEKNYSNKAEKVLYTLLNGKMLDLTTKENISFWKKIKSAINLYSAHFRCFNIFPKESLQFLWVLMKINTGKYLFKGKR